MLQYTRNQRVQQLSPFELDVTGPLFRNIGEKIRHKVEVSCVAGRARATPFLHGLTQCVVYLCCPPAGATVCPPVCAQPALYLPPRSPVYPPAVARRLFLRPSRRAQDNVWDVAPPLLFFVGLISFTLWKREEILHHHRD